MKNILTLNEISPLINDILKGYEIGKEVSSPIGIILRSFKMHDYALDKNTVAIARAGAGVNNIPVDTYADQGVVVFNTPGANANAVKELAITALLLGSRKIVDGINWATSLKGQGDEVAKLVEKGKAQFVGGEILGKKIGVIGFGAIGAKVANSAISLGMTAYAYDAFMNDRMRQANPDVIIADSMEEIFEKCDYISIHVPLLPDTKEFINAETIAKMKDGVVIINIARGELVNNKDIIAATASGKVARYVTDFPNDELLCKENIVCIPHLGASTFEAEDNCADMAARQLKDYIENGNIVNSVNYPAVSAPRAGKVRVTVNFAGGNSVAAITERLSSFGIVNTASAVRGNYGYAIFDLDKEVDPSVTDGIASINGVKRVRIIK